MITAEEMNKDVTVQVRLTAEEHKRWIAAAESEDRTLSNWIRRQCNAATTIEADQARAKEEFIRRGSESKTKKGGR